MNKIWSANVKGDDLKEAFIKYLNCPCRCFSPMKDDDPIISAYAEARERGKREGFIPVIIAYDEILWESLVMNAEAEQESEENKYAFDEKAVEIYRTEVLKLPLKSGKEALAEIWGADSFKEAEDITLEEIEKSETYEGSNSFSSYWEYSEKMTKPVILAEIPVKEPWEIFAYLPFGGWNECPDTPQLMSVIKHWNEKYGAVPAVITYDVMEMTVPEPVTDRKEALTLAQEQTRFCSDIVFQGIGTVPALANLLTKSSVWYFWWD